MFRTNNALCKVSIIPNEENSKTKICYGFSETTFKLRYANHKKKFSNIKCQNYAVLSNEYWNIMSANKVIMENLGNPQVMLHISKRCLLCLNETLAIAL